jgi:hypothetical protein
VKFGLGQPNPDAIQLDYAVNFAPTGMNANQNAVGNHFNSLQTNGGTATMAPVIAALYGLSTTADLAGAYSRMTQEPYVDQLQATHQSSVSFADHLFSCSAPGGAGVVINGSSCVWGRIDLTAYDRSATTQQFAYHEGATVVSGGTEVALAPDVRVGVGLSYEKAYGYTNAGQVSNDAGDRVQAGAVFKDTIGWAELAAAVTGGHAQFSVDRSVELPGAITARGRQSMTFGSVDVRVGHTFLNASGWVRPSMEIIGTQVHLPAFDEVGAGPLNLRLPTQTQNYWVARPNVEVSHDAQLSKTLWLRTTMRVGVDQVINGQASTLYAGFQGDEPATPLFGIRSRADATTGDASLSLALVNSRGASLRLGLGGQVGRTTREGDAQLKLVLPF